MPRLSLFRSAIHCCTSLADHEDALGSILTACGNLPRAIWSYIAVRHIPVIFNTSGNRRRLSHPSVSGCLPPEDELGRLRSISAIASFYSEAALSRCSASTTDFPFSPRMAAVLRDCIPYPFRNLDDVSCHRVPYKSCEAHLTSRSQANHGEGIRLFMLQRICAVINLP